jgi:hypothetical protein
LTTLATLRADLKAALRRRETGEQLPCPPLWDGRAAERIAEVLFER